MAGARSATATSSSGFRRHTASATSRSGVSSIASARGWATRWRSRFGRSGTWHMCLSLHAAGFALVRIPLALGEAGTFPSALAATADWFPKSRARLRHRPVQCRRQCRRHRHAADRSAHHVELRLAGCFYRNGIFDDLLARGMACLLPETERTQNGLRRGACLYPVRSGTDRNACAGALAGSDQAARELGLHPRPLSDRSDLVDLSLLAAGLLRATLRRRSQGLRAAAGGGLCSGRRRIDPGRLRIVVPVEARIEPQRRAQDGDARLRSHRGCRSPSRCRPRICGLRSC